MELKPYDSHVANRVFTVLFCEGKDREDGLKEIPSASLRLVSDALEYIQWDLSGDDRDTIKKAMGIVEILEHQQKRREWLRNKQAKSQSATP